MGKSLLLVSEKSQEWFSNKSISENLIQSYVQSSLSPEITYLSSNSAGVDGLARRIAVAAPERLVFSDSSPHPVRLLKSLAPYFRDGFRPELQFHIYGDFTVYARHWLEAGKYLHGLPVRLICASERQAGLVSTFLHRDCEEPRVCPFPVDSGRFFFSSDLRRQWRKRLKIRPSEVALVYAGRISLQKNVTLLTRLVGQTMSAHRNLRFFVAGQFDDIGAPYFALREPLGTQYSRWQSVLAGLDRSVRKRITYLGPVPHSQLPGLYCAGDAFVSLSLHHDEDFGMAAAEAFCCGSKAILTDWGGFSTFAESSGSACSLVPVRVATGGLDIATTAFSKSLREVIDEQRGDRLHAARARHSHRRFSVTAVAKRLEGIFAIRPKPFSGFGTDLEKLVERSQKWARFPTGPRGGTFYERVYRSYVRAAYVSAK